MNAVHRQIGRHTRGRQGAGLFCNRTVGRKSRSLGSPATAPPGLRDGTPPPAGGNQLNSGCPPSVKPLKRGGAHWVTKSKGWTFFALLRHVTEVCEVEILGVRQGGTPPRVAPPPSQYRNRWLGAIAHPQLCQLGTAFQIGNKKRCPPSEWSVATQGAFLVQKPLPQAGIQKRVDRGRGVVVGHRGGGPSSRRGCCRTATFQTMLARPRAGFARNRPRATAPPPTVPPSEGSPPPRLAGGRRSAQWMWTAAGWRWWSATGPRRARGPGAGQSLPPCGSEWRQHPGLMPWT